jgi:hypothetical protein
LPLTIGGFKHSGKPNVIGIRNDEGKWAANGAGFAELRESMMERDTNYDN